MKKSTLQALLVSSVAISIMSYCGRKKDDDDDSSSGDDPSAVTSSNPLAGSYPSSLAINAFPKSSSTSLTLVDDAEKTSKEKNEAAAKTLKGEGDCLPEAVRNDLKPGAGETCYEFDQEMIYGTTDTSKTALLGTKNGKNSAGEACLAAFARDNVKSIVGRVDRALGMVQMMLCRAKQKGVATKLENPNDSIDLKSSLSGVEQLSNITTAKVTRLTNVTDGSNSYESYKNELELTRKDGKKMKVTIYHVKKDEGNTKNYGVIQISEVVGSSDAGGQMTGSPQFMSTISYGRDVATDGTPTIAYELRNGIFNEQLVASAFGSDKLLDLNAGVSSDNTYTISPQEANRAVYGMTYVAFNGNPNTNEGTFSYWKNPGGTYTEAARGMIASLKLTDGKLAGCAISGSTSSSLGDGLSIRKALKTGTTLEPKAFLHPFFNSTAQSPATTGTDSTGYYYTKTVNSKTAKWYRAEDSTNGTKHATEQGSNLVSKQCFKQNSSGVYEIDTSVTTSAKGYEYVETETSKSVIDPPKQLFKNL